MKNLSWTFPEYKKALPEGEWQNEPDKMQWKDQETGLPCLIVRHAFLGTLCGYVGVDKNHPLFEKDYEEADVSVHGRLTFASHCSPSEDVHAICHVIEPGEEEVWWFGFDCGHSMDTCPAMLKLAEDLNALPGAAFLGKVTYKNIEYVKNECKELAAQLKNYK